MTRSALPLALVAGLAGTVGLLTFIGLQAGTAHPWWSDLGLAAAMAGALFVGGGAMVHDLRGRG